MANNRMYLRCKVCGHAIFLGSHLASPWSISADLDRINMFMTDHFMTCCTDPMMHSDDFEFAYESCEDESREIQDYSKVSYGNEIRWKHFEPPTEEEMKAARAAAEKELAQRDEWVRKYLEEHGHDRISGPDCTEPPGPPAGHCAGCVHYDAKNDIGGTCRNEKGRFHGFPVRNVFTCDDGAWDGPA